MPRGGVCVGQIVYVSYDLHLVGSDRHLFNKLSGPAFYLLFMF